MNMDRNTIYPNYEIEEWIGEGSFADVAKIRHKEFDHIRALKVMKASVSSDEKLKEAFYKECERGLQIGNGCHPNIIRISAPLVYKDEKGKEQMMVEMDYIEGETLHDYVKNKGYIQLDEIYRFIREIGGALAYCHFDCYKYRMNPEKDYVRIDPNNGREFVISKEKEQELVKKYALIHNDLHSNNIMRRKYDGSFVLMDFGLSIQDGHGVMSSKKNEGAIEYKAPEKWETPIITAQSDMYSFGVLVYQLLAGRVPFRFEDINIDIALRKEQEFSECVKKEAPGDINSYRKASFEKTFPKETYIKDFPDWLEKMVLKCLSKQPKDRYANAKEFINEFNLNFEIEKELVYIEKDRLDEEIKSNELLIYTLELNNKSLSDELEIQEKKVSSLKIENEFLKKGLEKMTKVNLEISDRLLETSKKSQKELDEKAKIIESKDTEIESLKVSVLKLSVAQVSPNKEATNAQSISKQPQNINKVDINPKSGHLVPNPKRQQVFPGKKPEKIPENFNLLFTKQQKKKGSSAKKWLIGISLILIILLTAEYYKGICSYGIGSVCQYWGYETIAAKFLRNPAEKGFAEAQNNIGDILYNAKNYKDAFLWYQKAALQGHKWGQYNLAYMYYTGLNTYACDSVKEVPNVGETVKWYKASALQGLPQAQNGLGDIYLYIKKYEEAFKWYQKAADQDYKWSLYSLGDMYLKGLGTKKDTIVAIDMFKAAASQGLPDGMNMVGSLLEEKKDYASAATWYKKAAELGFSQGQHNLAELYIHGLGVEKDSTIALDLFKMAAEKGLTRAQNRIGVIFDEQKNYEEAIKWFEKAANEGYDWAQYNLGNYYLYGISVRKDKLKACEWFSKAALQGLKEAQDELDAAYKSLNQGHSHKESFEWCLKAAKLGYIEAQREVANRYRSGNGVAQNFTEALMWFTKAAEAGDWKSQRELGNAYYYGKKDIYVFRKLNVEKDWKSAAFWLAQSVEHKDAYAYLSEQLGSMYEQGGFGLIADTIKAYKYYQDAIDKGLISVKEKLNKLNNVITIVPNEVESN